MKGKSGSSKMRGGGLARKGVGAAMKGGGLARKGVGAALKGGGKVNKMANGGVPTPGTMARALPPRLGGSPNPPSDTPVRRPKTSGPMVRPGFPSGPRGYGPNDGGPMPRPGVIGGVKTPKLPGAVPGQSPLMDQQTLRQIADLRLMESTMKKNGGKVAKYAKGGAVKMTAGAGSGLGRLEKVSAHKAAPRVKAENLKNGGKVKGKK